MAFVSFRPHAVSAGKIYLLAILLSEFIWAGAEALVIAMTTSDFSQLSYGFKDLLRTFVPFAIWFTYLSDSRQVANLFPKERRVTLGRDVSLLIGFLIATSIIALISNIPMEDEYGSGTNGAGTDAVEYDAIT